MSKKKALAMEQGENFFDEMAFDDEEYGDEDDMISTFGQVADASVEHMKVACDLTRLIMETHKSDKLSTDEILAVFRKASETILDCTPLKALFDKA